jgi:hypothetical protein
VNSLSQIKHRRTLWPTTQNTLPTRSSETVRLIDLFFSMFVSGLLWRPEDRMEPTFVGACFY